MLINQNTKVNALSWIFLIVILLALGKACSCNSEKKQETVTTPEVTGSFESVKPKQQPITTQTKKENKVFIQQSGNEAILEEEINRLLQENQELEEAHKNASDSLKNKLYGKAIELKGFSQKFNDDKIEATATGIVRGELQSLKLDYKIKPQTIEVPKQKEVVFRMLGGIEAGNTAQFNKFVAKVNVGFQIRNGDIITLSGDTDKRYYIGYTKSLFKIKGK